MQIWPFFNKVATLLDTHNILTVGDISCWALGRFKCKNGLFVMAVTEAKSAATPLNSLNPNKAQLDL